VTRLGRQRPYEARLVFPTPDEKRLREAARQHGGAFRGRAPEGLLATLEREAWAGEAVWTGGKDPLLDALRKGARLYWTAAYCRTCGDAACRRGSTQQARCQRLAEDIGAWDEVEIRDIFRLYRQGEESLETCYRRILEMHDLAGIIETARPRWPDAFDGESP